MWSLNKSADWGLAGAGVSPSTPCRVERQESCTGQGSSRGIFCCWKEQPELPSQRGSQRRKCPTLLPSCFCCSPLTKPVWELEDTMPAARPLGAGWRGVERGDLEGQTGTSGIGNGSNRCLRIFKAQASVGCSPSSQSCLLPSQVTSPTHILTTEEESPESPEERMAGVSTEHCCRETWLGWAAQAPRERIHPLPKGQRIGSAGGLLAAPQRQGSDSALFLGVSRAPSAAPGAHRLRKYWRRE